MYKLILSIFVFALLVGCDPLLTLVIKTDGTLASSVTIYGNVESMYPGNIEKPQSIAKVPFTDSIIKYKRTFGYGVGIWDTATVKDLVKNIDSIIIKTDSTALNLKEKPEIQKYLLNHRTGFMKSLIVIEPGKTVKN